MSTGAKEKNKFKVRHITFQTLLIITGLILAIIFEGVYVGICVHNVKKNETIVVEEELATEHDYFCDNLSECFYQVERVKSFIQRNNLSSYVKGNLNLIDSALAEEKTQQAEETLKLLSVSNSIIDSFVVIGSNVNQKNLYYDVAEKKIIESNFPTWEILENSGWTGIFLTNWGEIRKLELEEIQAKTKGNPSFTDREKESLDVMSDFLENRYFACNYVDNTMIIIRLNSDYLEQIFEMPEHYSFAVYDDLRRQILLFRNQQSSVSETMARNVPDADTFFEDNNNYYKCTYNLYGGLSAVTVKEKDMESRYVWMHLLILMLVITLVSFFVLYLLSRKMVTRLKQLHGAIKRQAQKHNFSLLEIEENNSYFRKTKVSRRIFVTLVSSSMISLILTSILFNVGTEYNTRNDAYHFGESVSKRYQNQFEIYYGRYNCISTQKVEKLIREFKDYYYDDYELLREFEEHFYYEASFLPGYSYSFVVDQNQNVVYQTMLSSQNQLAISLIEQAITVADGYIYDAVFVPTQDVFLGEDTIAFVKKIYSKNELIGHLIIVLDAPHLPESYMDGMLQTNYFIVNSQNECVIANGDKAYLKKMQRVAEGIYQEDELLFLMSEKLELYLGKCVIAFDYTFYSKQIEQHLYYGFVLMILIGVMCLVSAFILTQFLIRPFNLLMNYMRLIPEGNYKILPENNVMDEINEIAVAYNRMIIRLQEVVENTTKQAIRQQELELLQTQTEFKMLQQQINPHFIFNTLEIINLIAMHHGEQSISKMVKSLAYIMRYAISKSVMVTVQQEIEALEAYIDIQKFRFEDNFTIKLDLDRSLYECSMIKFILQPLVENAITHGMSQTTTGGEVSVFLGCYEDGLEFRVADNGTGMSEEVLAKLRESIYDPLVEYTPSEKGGIGLKNIYRRIQLFYKEEGELKIDSVAGQGTVVTIRLPFEFDD